MSTVTLRPWQRAAFDLFRATTGPDYLAVATPGAGKTTFALTCARAALADENRPLIVVVDDAGYISNLAKLVPQFVAQFAHDHERIWSW